MKRSIFNLLVSAAVMSLVGVGCGDDEPNVRADGGASGDGDSSSGDGDGSGGAATGGRGSTGGGTASGGTGEGGMGEGGSGDGDVTCATGQTECSSVCTNTESDDQNCGVCGNTCEVGEACNEGQCQRSRCSTGQVECSDECVDLQRDPQHCGSCDVACEAGEACDRGTCQTSCPSGQGVCNGTCIDSKKDIQYCGATLCTQEAGASDTINEGETCGGGQLCVDGACVLRCSSGKVICGGECIDPLKDRDYCGATTCENSSTSGTQCGDGQVCADGACATSCPSGQLVCGDICVDPGSDERFCGATACGDDSTDGELCDTGELCDAGVCTPSCGPNLIACGDACIDPYGSRDYCGATDCTQPSGQGVACGPTETCVIGECREFIPAWSPGERVDIIDEHPVYFYQRIKANAAGQAIAVWRQATVDDADSDVEFLSNRLYGSVYDPSTKSWSDQVMISQAEVDIRTIDLVMAADGTALVVWIEGSVITAGNAATVTNRLLASRFNGTAWGNPLRLDDGSDDATDPDVLDTPDLAMDASGNAYVVWTEGNAANGWTTDRVYGRRYHEVSGLDAQPHQFERVVPFDLDSNGRSYIVSPRLEVNASGKAVVAMLEYANKPGRVGNAPSAFLSDISALAEPVWSPGVDLMAAAPQSALRDAIDVGIDSQGNAHVVYAAGGNAGRNLYKDYYNAGTQSWATSVVTDILGDSGGTQIVRNVDLEVQAEGDAWVAFQTETAITTAPPRRIYAQPYEASSGTWGAYEVISAASTANNSRPVPAIASDTEGNTFVSWVRYDAQNYAEANRYDAVSKTWSGPTILNSTTLAGGVSPQLAVSSGGVAFSSWVQIDETNLYHFYVARFN